MKSIIVLIVYTLFSCQNNSYSDSINNSYGFPVQSEIGVLKKSFDEKNYKMFFESFPSSYKDFTAVYGYDEKTGKKPLYDVYESHINYFFKYEKSIVINTFLIKAFNITKNGFWDADAVGLFQSNFSKLILAHPDAVSNLLDKKSQKEVARFWYFIFDGSSKNDRQNRQKFNSIHQKIKTLNPKVAEILNQEFKKMYK